MNVVSGGLIEAIDYNDVALKVNRVFSDNTPGLIWSVSDLILNETADPAGEPAGAVKYFTTDPEATDFIVVIMNGVTLVENVDYTLNFTSPSSVTFINSLPSSAVIKAYNRTQHRYGWGQQASIYPISAGVLVRSDEETWQAYVEANVNNLIDKVNIMEARTSGPSSLTRITPGGVIYATDMSIIDSTLENDILYGNNIWKNDIATAFSNIASFTRTADWDNLLVGEMRHTWTSYDSMRYFFNSGNEIRMQIDMTGDTTSQGYVNWKQVADALGVVSLNYDTTFQSGVNGTSSNFGVYHLTDQYQRIFVSGPPSDPVDEFGTAINPYGTDPYGTDPYGTDPYGGVSPFENLVIVIEARLLEDTPNSGDVSVDLKVTLNDQDLNTTFVGTTTYVGSYLMADDLTDNSASFSISSHIPNFSVINDFDSYDTKTITNISNANPGIVTVDDTSDLYDGMTITISGVNGMTEVNNNSYTITVVDHTTISINVDTTTFGSYVSGGTVTYPLDN